MWSATGDRPRSGKAVKRESSTACKGFPINVERLIRRARRKAKEARPSMQSDLDRRFDEVLAEVTGPGGTLEIEGDEQGRAIVAKLPPTLPLLFRAFCALHGAAEAVVAGEERLSCADLDRISERLAHGLAARGIGKGDRVGIMMRKIGRASCRERG